MKALKDYEINQYGMFINYATGDEGIIPWHSILSISRSHDDMQVSIVMISMTTLTLRLPNKEVSKTFMKDVFNNVGSLSDVVVA